MCVTNKNQKIKFDFHTMLCICKFVEEKNFKFYSNNTLDNKTSKK